MKLYQLIKLGNADFRARRKTIIHTVIAASIPFVVLFTINLTLVGTENVLLRESGKVTDNAVFLTISASAGDSETIHSTAIPKNNTTQAITEHGGEILAKLSAEEAEKYAKPMAYFAEVAKIDLNKVTLNPQGKIVDPTPENFKLVDFLLDGIYYSPPGYNTEDLVESLDSQQMYLVKFPGVAKAYNYAKYIQDNNIHVGWNEPFSNLLAIYTNFRRVDHDLKLFEVVFVIVAIIIVISSFVYLLDQNVHSMVVYRALGANTLDLLVISLTYLLEVGLCIIICSLAVSSVLAMGFSWVSAEYVTGVLTKFYSYEPTSVLLLGWSLDMMIVRLAILAAAPISLLLMLDQFSIQNLTKRLKKE